MRIIFLISLAFFLKICVPDMTPAKKILKSMKVGKAEVEWFSFSSAYADVPDCITIKKGKWIDTICRSNNIADLQDLGNNEVLIGFYGRPNRYGKLIELNQSISGITIVVDTAYTNRAKSVY